MSELKVKGGRRRARFGRRLTSLAIYAMRYGTVLASIWLIGFALDLVGLVPLGGSSRTQFLGAVGLLLVSRLLGVGLLALAGMLTPRARPLLTSAMVVMPSTDHTRRPVDRHPEEGSQAKP
jgi:CHASE2 domain-containing sensor protein